MKTSNGVEWEIKKFNKEIRDLRRLKQAQPDEPLTLERAEVIKHKVLTAIAQEPQPALAEASLKTRLADTSQRFIRFVVSVLLGLSLVGGSAFASDSAKPGEVLYPIKRFKEKVELGLALSEQGKAGLEAKFAQERLTELQEISVEKYQAIIKTTEDAGGDLHQATSTTTKIDDDRKHKLEVQVRQDAAAAVTDAMHALEKVQTKLKAKGDNRGADSVNNDILNLKGHAKEQHVYPTDKRQSQDDNKNTYFDER